MESRPSRRRTRSWCIVSVLVLTAGALGCRDRRPPSRPATTQGASDQSPVRQPVAPPPADDSTLGEAVRTRAGEATVFIETRYRPLGLPEDQAVPDDKLLVASGSGVIVSAEGLVLTNAHVVSPVEVAYPGLDHPEQATPAERLKCKQVLVRDSVTVWIHCGTDRAKKLSAQVLCTRGGGSDLALLRVRHRLPLTALPIADALLDPPSRSAPQNTQKVWALGFPLGRSLEEALESVSLSRNPNGPDISIRGGQITALRHGEDGKLKAIEHSCQCEHGNSGGPLINARGQLVGLETWGVSRADFAIPLDVVLAEFGQTLRTMGHSAVAKGPARRTLLVESSAPADSDLVFRTLGAAYAAARDGDTIEVSEGTHACDEKLEIAKSIWIRGSGVDKTKLGSGNLRLTVACPGYVELSDLSAGLYLIKSVSDEAYVHDVGGEAIVLDGARACVVNGRPDRDFVVQNGAVCRIERSSGLIDLNDCTAELLGCVGRSTPWAMPMTTGINVTKGRATFAGCKFLEKTGLTETTVAYRDCLFADTLLIDGASSVTVSGCHFRNSSVQARSTSCQFKECFFQPDRFTALGGLDEAVVRVEGCAFVFDGFVPGGQSKPPPRLFVYGVVATNKSKLVLRNNSFATRKDWAKSRETVDEGNLVDEGGNDEQRLEATDGAYRSKEP